jgi:hypothetical protein
MTFLILSIKWSGTHRGEIVWWRPNDEGYTTEIPKAGRYTAQQIAEQPDYYNNGRSTLAIADTGNVYAAARGALAVADAISSTAELIRDGDQRRSA